MKRPLTLSLLALAGAASAQNFVLETAVLDSRSGASLGVASERGEVGTLFRAQKSLTFGILRAAGIDLDTLAPEVRARIERFQTTNLAAFRAFSSGLDLKDQGRFAEAREQFRRAAELDPGFGLASEQQQAMPEITTNSAVQLRAALATSAGQAVSRGQASFVVDAQRAIAAAQGGLTVVQGPQQPTDAQILEKGPGDEYGDQQAGGTSGNRPNLATATAFGFRPDVRLALSNEWKAGEYLFADGQFDAAAVPAESLALRRDAASAVPGGSTDLADGSRVYWGRWMSTASASATVILGGGSVPPSVLGAVEWIAGEATRQLPGTGIVRYAAGGGGNLTDVNGRIAVDFLQRSVTLQNLGFTLDGLVFSGLQGQATMRPGSLSGLFGASYTAGSCAGCSNFLPTGSSFGGNFVGRNADGMLFSTTMATDGGTRAGVTVMKKEPLASGPQPRTGR